jgi:hypothetical protein
MALRDFGLAVSGAILRELEAENGANPKYMVELLEGLARVMRQGLPTTSPAEVKTRLERLLEDEEE